jgi:hypothetical protein
VPLAEAIAIIVKTVATKTASMLECILKVNITDCLKTDPRTCSFILYFSSSYTPFVSGLFRAIIFSPEFHLCFAFTAFGTFHFSIEKGSKSY